MTDYLWPLELNAQISSWYLLFWLAVLSFYSQYRAHKALKKLQELQKELLKYFKEK
jgi:hypothetical protein